MCVGLVDAGTGDYTGAAGEYQKAIELEPSNAHAYAGLATAYAKLNRLSDAENTYKQAIAANPNLSFVYQQLAIFYAQQADYARAADLKDSGGASPKQTQKPPRLSRWPLHLPLSKLSLLLSRAARDPQISIHNRHRQAQAGGDLGNALPLVVELIHLLRRGQLYCVSRAGGSGLWIMRRRRSGGRIRSGQR